MLSRYCDPGGVYYPFDIFMQMLPLDELIHMVILTNFSIYSETRNNNDPATPGKLLKWIVVLIMSPHVEFLSYSLLYISNTRGKQLKALCFWADWNIKV